MTLEKCAKESLVHIIPGIDLIQLEIVFPNVSLSLMYKGRLANDPLNEANDAIDELLKYLDNESFGIGIFFSK